MGVLVVPLRSESADQADSSSGKVNAKGRRSWNTTQVLPRIERDSFPRRRRRSKNRSRPHRRATPSAWPTRRMLTTTSAMRFIARASNSRSPRRKRPSRSGLMRSRRTIRRCSCAAMMPIANTIATSSSARSMRCASRPIRGVVEAEEAEEEEGKVRVRGNHPRRGSRRKADRRRGNLRRGNPRRGSPRRVSHRKGSHRKGSHRGDSRRGDSRRRGNRPRTLLRPRRIKPVRGRRWQRINERPGK